MQNTTDPAHEKAKKLKRYSLLEECADCGETFSTEWAQSRCPGCGSTVISCNCCLNHDQCWKCFFGSHHESDLTDGSEDRYE